MFCDIVVIKCVELLARWCQ